VFVLKGAEWEAYGNFSFALQPYLDQKITDYLYSRPGVQDIANVVDPLVYIKRYTFPVWSISACGDEFTLPDSPRFWFDQLPAQKFIRVIPSEKAHVVSPFVLALVF
jgi:PhoPQ-activated pathogenicity-related protein